MSTLEEQRVRERFEADINAEEMGYDEESCNKRRKRLLEEMDALVEENKPFPFIATRKKSFDSSADAKAFAAEFSSKEKTETPEEMLRAFEDMREAEIKAQEELLIGTWETKTSSSKRVRTRTVSSELSLRSQLVIALR